MEGTVFHLCWLIVCHYALQSSDQHYASEVGGKNYILKIAFFNRFAAALIENQLDCWVLNVVPVSGKNTLPVIVDRGLLGVMHDW